MPETLSGAIQASAFGRQYNVDLTRQTETGKPFSPSVRKGYTGELTTRTDNNTGVITVDDADHDITTADFVALFWEIQTDPAQATAGRRRVVAVTAVTGAAISVDLGAGDNLPLLNSAVIITPMEPVNINVDGDDLKGLMLGAEGAETMYSFYNSDGPPTEDLYVPVLVNKSYFWSTDLGTTNPLAGVIVGQVWCGHNNTLTAQICNGCLMHD